MLGNNKLLIVALVLVGAVQIHSTAVVLPKIGNDYFIGDLTADSVLAHTERVTGSISGQLSWHGLFNITRIEVFDQTIGTGYLSNRENGVNTFHVQLTFNAVFPYTESFDFIVDIYGEPLERLPSNDFFLGEETSNSRLILTESVNSTSGYAYFGWYAPNSIVRAEALDQNDGFGGYVTEYIFSENAQSIHIFFASVFPNSTIDFIVNIFIENPPSNDFIDGNLTENSILLHTQRVIDGGLMSWSNGSFIITRVEAFDQTNGSGGVLFSVSGGIGYRYADLYFQAWIVGSSIDFIVNIFGEPAQSNDVILGEIDEANILIDSRRIKDSTIYTFTSAHVITRIEILDQSNGNGGYVSDIFGGLSSRYIYVFILPVYYTSTIDFIVNLYAHPLTPNHFFDGELTSSSALLHQERFIGEFGGYYNFYWRSLDSVVTRIEAYDQSIGDGGFVYGVYSGVNSTFVQILFESVLDNSRIDFVINIYGETNWPSDKLIN